MAKDPAFLFYPGDYLRDTQLLSETAQVAYDRIMCEHMRNICITQHQVNFLTKRLEKDEREHLMTLLKRINGGYQIEWVAESIEKRILYSESRRRNKQGKKNNTCETYDTHMENENEDVNKDIIKDIIDYINKVLKTNYKYNSKVTNKHINARLEEGFSVDDFYLVIEKKARQWKDNSKMAPYLRPITLFSTKFESYLNEITPQEKTEFQKNVERTLRLWMNETRQDSPFL